MSASPFRSAAPPGGGCDVVFTYYTDTWNDAAERGFMRPPDQLVLTLLEHPGIERLLVADPRRFVLAQARRQLLRRGLAPLPEPTYGQARLLRPLRATASAPREGRALRRALAAHSSQLRRAAYRFGMRRPALLTCDPLLAGLAPLDWAGAVTYYARDDFAAHHGDAYSRPALMAAYAQMRARSLPVVAVSEPILDAIGTSNGTVVPNGVNPAEWRQRRPAPAWFAALERPRLLYTGTLDRRLDPDLIRAAGAAVPGGTVVLLGPTGDPDHVARLRALPNVQTHDNVGRAELTACVMAADACVIPHVRSDLTRAMSPLKLYEYLAAGRPVVASDLAPMHGVHESVILVPPGGDFTAAVTAALRQGPLPESERERFVADNAWSRRHTRILAAAIPGLAASAPPEPSSSQQQARPAGGAANGYVAGVVIPVKGDAAGLARTLAALALQAGLPGPFEVVVVDNGSQPPLHLPTGPRPAQVRLVQEGRPGSYAARAAGVAQTSAPVLAFTDAGCEPAPTWLAEGLRALDEPGVCAVGGRVRLTFAEHTARTCAEVFERERAFPQEAYIATEHFAVTANLLVTRAAYEQVDGFDVEAQSGGDLDFGRRLRRASLTLRYAADARVDHAARRTLAEIWAKGVRVSRGVRRLDTVGSLAEPSQLPVAGAGRLRTAGRHLLVAARGSASALLKRCDLPAGDRWRLAVGHSVWHVAAGWGTITDGNRRQRSRAGAGRG